MTGDEASRGAAAPAGSARIWLFVVLFGLGNAVSFLDRSFLTLVLDTVRRHYGLTDTQMGLLIGPAFMLCYSVVALPLGALADRANRKRLIVAGMGFWSFCTALFGLAHSFWVLALARMGVGLGEAALSPAAVSIISDYFPRTSIGRAIGLFTAMAAFGGSAAFILGGLLMKVLTAQGPVSAPLAGSLEPWQLAFLIISLPGMILAVIIGLVVREPIRRHTAQPRADAGWAATLRYLGRHPRATLAVIAGFSVISAGSAGNAWMATLFLRAYGWGPGQAGPYLGLIQLVAGFTGMLAGGALADRLRRRGYEDANVLIAIGGLLVALPCDLLAPNAGDPYATLALIAPANFFTMMCYGAATPALPLVAPPQFRAKIVAVYILSGNLVGIGLGPVLVPLFTDHLFHDAGALRYSMTLTPAILLPIAIALLLWSRRAYAARVVALRDAADTSDAL